MFAKKEGVKACVFENVTKTRASDFSRLFGAPVLVLYVVLYLVAAACIYRVHLAKWTGLFGV